MLDYGDVLLRQSDVDLLRGPHWLNDQVMAATGHSSALPSMATVWRYMQNSTSVILMVSRRSRRLTMQFY